MSRRPGLGSTTLPCRWLQTVRHGRRNGPASGIISRSRPAHSHQPARSRKSFPLPRPMGTLSGPLPMSCAVSRKVRTCPQRMPVPNLSVTPSTPSWHVRRRPSHWDCSQSRALMSRGGTADSPTRAQSRAALPLTQPGVPLRFGPKLAAAGSAPTPRARQRRGAKAVLQSASSSAEHGEVCDPPPSRQARKARRTATRLSDRVPQPASEMRPAAPWPHAPDGSPLPNHARVQAAARQRASRHPSPAPSG